MPIHEFIEERDGHGAQRDPWSAHVATTLAKKGTEGGTS